MLLCKRNPVVAVEASAFQDAGFSRLSALPALAWFSSFGSSQGPQSGPGSHSSHPTQGPGIKEEAEGRAEKNLTTASAPLKEFS